MSDNKPQIALIKKSDLTLCDSQLLSENQLQFILRPTPEKFKRKRPAKGGGTWDYVSVGYIQKALNLMFGWDWDFEVTEQIVNIEAKEVICKGRLTVRIVKDGQTRTITKTQFGNKDIMFRKDGNIPLSLGNDLKSAASDALKKCASMLGIAQDVYNATEFKEVVIEETVFKDVALMLTNCENAEEVDAVYFMLNEEEQAKYLPLINRLKNGF